MYIAQRKKQKINKTQIKSAKRREQEKLAALYHAERAKLYSGEEEFMNTLHPFEELGKNSGKKSSPIQKAIISCIKEKGGSATEDEILEYVKEKWEIIMKYSERGFALDPSIRVIRLNCAVKKKARHLFLKDPNKKDAWILNSRPRKIPVRKNSLSTRTSITNDDDEEEEIIDSNESSTFASSPEVFAKQYVMAEETFERRVEHLIRESGKKMKLNDITNELENFEKEPGIFASLPLERRVRACLIVLKSERKVKYNENTQEWFSVDLRDDEVGGNRYNPNENHIDLRKLSIDEFYDYVMKKSKKTASK